MSDTKPPTESIKSIQAARSRALKDKAPPKPPRRFSTIPAALAVSGTASRIPPAPRPPRPPTGAQQLYEAGPKSVRPKSSRSPNLRAAASSRSPNSRPKGSRPEGLRRQAIAAKTWAFEEGHADRETTRPVARSMPPAPRRDARAIVLGVGAASLLLVALWFVREPAQSRSEPMASFAGQVARSARAIPAPDPIIDIDAEAARASQPTTANVALASARAPQELPAITVIGEPRRQAAVANDTQPQPALEAPVPPSAPTPETAAAPAPPLPAFDAEAARRALGTSAIAASSCRKSDAPGGPAEVIVTFAPSGRVTSANVNGGPYGGTATGGCIAATLRAATVPPFAGSHVTVRKLVTVR